jgi:hypothetical protein
MIGSQVMRCVCGSTGLPSKSVTRTESLVSTASSPSPRKKTSRVCCKIGGTSEATKYSPSPRPMTTGGPWRTAMMVSASSVEMMESAKMPRRSRTAKETAFSKESSVFRYSSTRCATTSVSVSVTKRWSVLRRRSLSWM